MTILRSILAVIVGYAIFVASALVLFRMFHIDPHAEPSVLVMIAVIAWGTFFSWLGGLVAQLIAGAGTPIVNYILAAVLAGFAAFSFFKSEGNHYTQVAAIFLFAPMSVLGGLFLLKRKRVP